MKLLNFHVTSALFSLLLVACGSNSSGSVGEESNSLLVRAAQAEISESNLSGNPETACSIFVRKVLRRAGIAAPGFRANDFDEVMNSVLPEWEMAEFAMTKSDRGRDALRIFLNSLPDGTGVLAQWERVGRSGHVAIIEKVAVDEFRIYQAQQGLSVAKMKPIAVTGLLYARNEYGDRSTLRLYSSVNND